MVIAMSSFSKTWFSKCFPRSTLKAESLRFQILPFTVDFLIARARPRDFVPREIRSTCRKSSSQEQFRN